MIQANELRIGNYIYDDFNEVHIVEKIESKKYNEWNGSDPSLVVFSKIDDEYRGMYTCDVVSGIPLTEEWLLKFGFNYSTHSFNIEIDGFDSEFPTWKYNDDWFIAPMGKDTGFISIKYVHQLQNIIFALTGSELVLSNVPASNQS